MRLTIFQKILAFTFFFSCSLARNSHRDLLKRNPGIANRSVHYGEGPVEMTKRGQTKYVLMHHIVGNTYTYSISDWKADIQQIQGKGVDALALNIGSDVWELTQVANAYSAAESLGTGFKMFLSFDFTAMACTLSNLVSSVNRFANHPNQLKINGRPMVSSFEGKCLGNSGWASLKSQTNGYIMPFISGLEWEFSQWPALDSWLCWGCAWPPGDKDKTTDDDFYYINQLGSRYATDVSGWIFAHFGSKNFMQRSDDWLINSRWEQLISMRNDLTFVEMVTWNDYGESDYFGPVKTTGSQPWAINFPHTAWFDMSQYYITAFKTGSYPAISKDVIYYWARPHPAAANAINDPLPKPSGSTFTQDFMWAAVFATSEATVTLRCGSSSSTFTVTPGVNKLKIPLAAGGMSVKMVRNGQTIIDETAQGYTYVLVPEVYNYNAWVGSASSIANTDSHNSPPSTPHSSSQSTKPSSATTAKAAALIKNTATSPTSSSPQLTTPTPEPQRCRIR